MKKILYFVPALAIVLLGFTLKVRAANDYKYYLHEDDYVYWMPDYTDFSTNNGLFTFQDFYECANSEGLGQYAYEVNAMFDPGDVRRVEIYQNGGWYPLDSYEISNNDWSIEFNANDDDTIYTITSNDFEFWYQVDGDPLVETSLAGIRFLNDESQIVNNLKTKVIDYFDRASKVYSDNNVYRIELSNFVSTNNLKIDGYLIGKNSIHNFDNGISVNYEPYKIRMFNDNIYISLPKDYIDLNYSESYPTNISNYLNDYPITLTYEIEKQDLIYNFNLINYPEPNALYDTAAYQSYNIYSQYLSVRFKSIDLENIIEMNGGVMPEIIFKVNGVENNFYPYEEINLTLPADKKIRDRTFLFNVHTVYYNDLYMCFNFRYPEYELPYHQYNLEKAEVDIRKLQVTIIFKDVFVESETDISELIQQAYNRGYSDGLTIGYEDAFNAGYDEGKRIADILQYQHGYDAGYEDGAVAGNEDAFNAGYEAGFIVGSQESEAYNAGYADGANESFLGSMDKWLVPSIIIVMLLGGFFAIARKKRDGDI